MIYLDNIEFDRVMCMSKTASLVKLKEVWYAYEGFTSHLCRLECFNHDSRHS